MKRPENLQRIALAVAWPPAPGSNVMTMSVGQWDNWLKVAYEDGWTLLELDDEERPLAAYRKGGNLAAS